MFVIMPLILYKAAIQAFLLGLSFEFITFSVAPWAVENSYSYAYSCFFPFGIVRAFRVIFHNQKKWCAPKLGGIIGCINLAASVGLITMLCLMVEKIAFTKDDVSVMPYFITALLGLVQEFLYGYTSILTIEESYPLYLA